MVEDPILQVEDLVAGYTPEVDILHGVDLEVGPEEIVAVIGPNGAGKSTLIKAIFGLLTPREGRVLLRGEDLTGLSPERIVREGLAYVPQLENVFPSLSVRENLEMGGWIREGGVAEAIEEVYDLFPVLRERQGQAVGEMSGGQRQMVAMGRALVADPDLLLLDEPSAGLAPDLVDDVLENVDTVRRAGTPSVVVEQNAKRVLALADRGYVLDAGENRFTGPGDELLDDPEVGRLYLGA